MDLPEKVFLVGVPYPWYQAIKAHYIVSGSKSVDCWSSLSEVSTYSGPEPDPGALMMFTVQREGRTYICGGGFYCATRTMEPSKAWDLYGVNNGADSFKDFREQLLAAGWREGEKLVANVINGCFAFSRHESYQIPDELGIRIRTGTTIPFSLNNPDGRFLARVVMHRRSPHLRPGTFNNEWPGIYLMAAEKHARDYSMVFFTQMLRAYDFRCAVTGDRTQPLLDVAHIRTFYDERFTNPCNGIVMRTDIHRLFSQGYITCEYASDSEVVVIVSKDLAVAGGGEYMKYDGVKLSLPEDKAMWPSRDYLVWHHERRFENWLRFGMVKPANENQGTVSI
jgi:putative restriction endonuclease